MRYSLIGDKNGLRSLSREGNEEPKAMVSKEVSLCNRAHKVGLYLKIYRHAI